MRKFITILENFHFESKEELAEHEIVVSLAGEQADAAELLTSATPFGEIESEVIYRQDHGDTSVFCVGDPRAPKAISKMVKSGAYWWSLELKAFEAARGWGSKLFVFLVKRLGRVFNDPSLTPASVAMLEKLIASKALKASVVDIAQAQATTYNPDDPKDVARPMYDRPLAGVNRALLSPDEARNIVWMVEGSRPRAGVLKPLTMMVEGLRRPY